MRGGANLKTKWRTHANCPIHFLIPLFCNLFFQKLVDEKIARWDCECKEEEHESAHLEWKFNHDGKLGESFITSKPLDFGVTFPARVIRTEYSPYPKVVAMFLESKLFMCKFQKINDKTLSCPHGTSFWTSPSAGVHPRESTDTFSQKQPRFLRKNVKITQCHHLFYGLTPWPPLCDRVWITRVFGHSTKRPLASRRHEQSADTAHRDGGCSEEPYFGRSDGGRIRAHEKTSISREVSHR